MATHARCTGASPSSPGWLSTGTVANEFSPYASEFLRGMAELGYVEGRNIDLERRYAAGDLRRLPALANELVNLKPDVILTTTSAAALAFTQATQSIPIVATAMVDPVGFGLAASEARPGGQVTGILISLDALPGKQLALALEVVPRAAIVGVLLNGLNPTTAVYRAGIEAAAANLPIKLVPVEVRGSDDLNAAFQEFLHEKVDLVFVAQDSLLLSERARLAFANDVRASRARRGGWTNLLWN